MARGAHEGLRRLRPDRRPIVISRSGYAGLAAARAALDRRQLLVVGAPVDEHAAASEPRARRAWPGSASTSAASRRRDRRAAGPLDRARHLSAVLPQPLGLGHAAAGAVGLRRARTRRPIRDMLLLRQRLMPYLYSLFEECTPDRCADPAPAAVRLPGRRGDLLGGGSSSCWAARCWWRRSPGPGIEYRHVYLPRGTWFHFWTGERSTARPRAGARAAGPAGRCTSAPTPPFRCGRPCYDGERAADPLTWLIFPADGERRFELYEDAGDGYAFEQGDYARTRATCTVSADRIQVQLCGPRRDSPR